MNPLRQFPSTGHEPGSRIANQGLHKPLYISYHYAALHYSLLATALWVALPTRFGTDAHFCVPKLRPMCEAGRYSFYERYRNTIKIATIKQAIAESFSYGSWTEKSQVLRPIWRCVWAMSWASRQLSKYLSPHFSAWSPPFIIFTHRISGTLFACSPATMATLSGNSTSYGTARLVKLRRTENRESSTRNVQAPLPGHWCWRDAFDRHCPGNNICMRRNWVQSARMKQSSNGGISPRQLLMHCYARNLFDKIRTTLNL